MAKVNQVFQRAADLIEIGGWCQRSRYQVGIDGFEELAPARGYAKRHGKSLQCSLLGALILANQELDTDPDEAVAAAGYLQARLGLGLEEWNDQPETTSLAVINLLHRSANWWPILPADSRVT